MCAAREEVVSARVDSAAAATWIVRGDESRPRLFGRDRYFPALEPGATHEEVDKRTLVDAVRAIEGDEKRIAKLVAGARRVDDDFFCSACLADYVGAVLDRVRARFYDDAFASRLRRSGGCAALGRLVEVDLAASFKLRDARPACRALAEP